MAIFDRFRRNRQQSVLPDEVRQYYQSEQRSRRGVAFLFALIALLVTILIAAALFFGGRAIYRSVNNDDGKKTGQGQSQNQNQNQDGQASSTNTDKPNSNTNTPQPAPATSSTPSTPPPTTPTVTPSAGDVSGALPRTGDEGL